MKSTISHTVYIDVADVLGEISNADLLAICEAREILPKPKPEPKKEEIDQARYELDSLIHELREAFLARDHQHFEVLLQRAEEGWADVWVEAMANA